MPSRTIRILVDAMPRILREIIVRAIERQPDMVLVQSERDLANAIKDTAAHVLIVADTVISHTAPPHELLVDNPELKIVVVADDGRNGHVLEFRRSAVVPMSPQGLITAIRAAVA